MTVPAGDSDTDGVPLVFIVTGEPSGDLLGARLMAALRTQTGGRVRFKGIGGEAMAEEGLDSLYDLGEFAVMGLTEVLPKARRILTLIKAIAAEIERDRPAVLVTIDSWGLTMRVNKAVRGLGVPQVHYVAPMVWAWRKKRIHQLPQWTDRLMCLLPDEPALVEGAGLYSAFVGHAVIESGADKGDGARFRAAHDIPSEAPVLVVLPGSRRSETSRMLPIFAEAVSALAAHHPGLHLAVPTVANVEADVRAAVADWALPATVVTGRAARYDAFAAAKAALATSGTVALELSLAGVPHVICYKVSALTAWLFRRVSDHKYGHLINVLNDAEVVRELIQEDCTPVNVLAEAERLLSEGWAPPVAERVRATLDRLKPEGEPPSQRAARIVLDAMSEKKGPSP